MDGHSSTYLYEAQEENNVEAVRFLLELGANPSYCNEKLDNDCALWNLQYLWMESEDDDQINAEIDKRIEIAKVVLGFIKLL